MLWHPTPQSRQLELSGLFGVPAANRSWDIASDEMQLKTVRWRT